MITFSLVSGGTSVAALFMAGYIPGILWGLACMLVIFVLAKRNGYISTVKMTGKKKLKVFFTSTAVSALDRYRDRRDHSGDLYRDRRVCCGGCV